MTVTIVDDPAVLAAMAPEWHALCLSSGAGPFQSPHWLLPWWAAFGTARLRVAVLREGAALAGVLPAYVLGEAGGAKMLPVGAGTTDTLDVVGAGARPLLHALLHRAAAEGVARFDLMEVPPGSALRDVQAPAGWRASWQEGESCPVLELAAIPAGIRRKLRMNRNRAERAGGWTTETATPDTLEACLGALVGLHQARWIADGEPGVLCDPAVLAFLRHACPRLLAAGLLRLSVLRVGGRVAAAILALLGPGRLYFYASGYDVAQSFVSPGTLLLGAMLDEAQREGRTEAHFLRGREAYKYAWGAVDRFNAGCALEREV